VTGELERLDTIGDAGLRAALVYARAQASPVTADQLASALEIHRNVARSRLERLAGAGWLTVDYERRTGRSGPGAGRPAKTYAVAPELSTVEFPAARYDRLIDILLDALPREKHVERLRQLGGELGRQLSSSVRLRPAKTTRLAFERLCAAFRQLGYQATLLEANERGALIQTPTCPLRPLVRRRADAAELDRGMWEGFAAVALRGTKVRSISCETHDCLDGRAPCLIRIELS
jgi:predicted ArsR family transcriptional regulator